MDELLGVVVEAGAEIIGASSTGGQGKNGCIWLIIGFVVIGVGVTLYYVL